MKVLGLREAKQSLSVCIEKSQKDRVLITRHGKPAAVVIGVAGQEMDDVILQMDPKFWKMIEEHVKIEKQMVEIVQNALGCVKGNKMALQEYLLEYLREDEIKHNTLLKKLETIKHDMLM